MASTTEMLHRLNHYKDSPNPIFRVIDEGFSPLGMSVEELAGSFNDLDLSIGVSPVSLVSRAERMVSPPPDSSTSENLAGGFNDLNISPVSCAAVSLPPDSSTSETEEGEASPSICSHGFRRAQPIPPSVPGICPHGFRRANVDLCPHGVKRSQTPETLDVCPHGFTRAHVEVCPTD
ncbi:hypothetical protein FB451DRAFT_1177572 [Mycena latifolia]|nr:hypothetical protein FB451DRAFT_1177572 [Mycena latifolia]